MGPQTTVEVVVDPGEVAAVVVLVVGRPVWTPSTLAKLEMMVVEHFSRVHARLLALPVIPQSAPATSSPLRRHWSSDRPSGNAESSLQLDCLRSEPANASFLSKNLQEMPNFHPLKIFNLVNEAHFITKQQAE